MFQINKDKIIALLGSTLLGYYLAISLFRGWLWSLLISTLPPINNRFLPTVYLGLIGGAIGLALGYLVFTRWSEKKIFREHRKHYVFAIIGLIGAPLLLTTAFRWQAINFVQTAESTAPTELRITVPETMGSSIMFQTSQHSASGVAKRAVCNTQNQLTQIGKLINQMKLVKVVTNDAQIANPSSILWLDYQVKGHWYSKILGYRQGYFAEEVANNRLALYQSPELMQQVKQILAQADELSNYNQARILSSKSFNENRADRHTVSGPDFQQLIKWVGSEHQIQPESSTVTNFQNLLENGVPQGNENIYAIELTNTKTPSNTNFMVYDQAAHLLWFNQHFYQADIDLE